MTKSLAEYISETSQSYEPSRQALQSQIDSLDAQLAQTKENINNQYAFQRNQLLNSANQAAEAATLSAAGSGGAFGGAANLANKKYYRQTYTPAIAQSNNNLNTALMQAESDKNSTYQSLAKQLADLQTQANTYGTQRYDAAVEAERQDALARAQLEESRRQANLTAAANNAYNSYLQQALAASNQQNQVKSWDFGNGYKVYDNNGTAVYTKNGNQVSAGDFLGNVGANWDTWKDIWNSGVSTTGVGSDTISAFLNTSPVSTSKRWGYLWS